MSGANPPGPSFKTDWSSTGSAPEHVAAHNDLADYLNNLSLDGLTDVTTTSTGILATGHILVYSTSLGQFKPSTEAFGSGGVTAHTALTGVLPDQHHNEIHDHSSTNEGGTVAHSALTGIGSSDHHVWPPTVALLSDTTAAGSQLNTLVGGGNADALHTHTAAGTQATTDLTDWSTGTPTDGALARYSSTAAAWVYISTTALAGATALPTTIVEGITTGHVQHQEKLHVLFNAVLGVST